MISAGESHPFEQQFSVTTPSLWHPDHPWLYTLRTVVLRTGRPVDELPTKFGIRHVELGTRLLINGEEFHICGSNRHQEYPYLEYALSPSAAWRDAVKIKEAGLNFIRLSHYPQDPAFLDACDELGILVQAPIPGWQMFRANTSFVAQSNQDVRDLIRRDRNHPCVLFWEPNLNESDGQPEDFTRANYEIAHAEYPGDQCITFGDSYPKKKGWGWDVNVGHGLYREYGDWSFGGNESTTRQTRANGEKAMLQQAWNFQWCLNNMNRYYDDKATRFLGSATWCMFDYNRGYDKNPCWAGMMDTFRLPKFTYYFFQSQRDPRLKSAELDSGPVVHIANFWTPRTGPSKVVVYSNCQEIELQLNGRILRRQKPDSGPDTNYSGTKTLSFATDGDSGYDNTGGKPYDGGNALHLVHPPFTFADVPWQAGELKAVGYLNGQVVSQDIVRTPLAPASIQLEFDTAHHALMADGADAIFVRARVLDKNGTLVPEAIPEITFTVQGNGKLVGKNPLNAEAGIASVLLQSGLEAGTITVTAQAKGFKMASATIPSVPSSVVKVPGVEIPPPLIQVVPTADVEKTTWRFSLDKPSVDWNQAAFDDSKWLKGLSSFGQGSGPVGTNWDSADIWLRHEFTLPNIPTKTLVLRMEQDDSAQAYINGVLVTDEGSYSEDYREFPLPPAVLATLKPDKNVLAIHCHQNSGPQFIDAGISESTAPG